MATLPSSSSSSPCVCGESLLRRAAEHSLHAFLEPNAIFLAERLHAQYPSSSSRNLLATAYLRHGQLSLAADTLRPSLRTSPENRYLYAVCHVRMGTDAALREAESQLTRTESVPGGAAGMFLLASIYHKAGRRDDAVTTYRTAITQYPLMWVAFERLAALGVISSSDPALPPVSDTAALQALLAQPPFTPGVCAGDRNTSVADGTQAVQTPVAASRKQGLVSSKRAAQHVDQLSSASMSRPMTRAAAAAARANFNDDTHFNPHVHVHAHTQQLFTTPSPAPNPPSTRRMAGRSMSPGLRVGRRGRPLLLDDSSVRNPSDLFAATPPSASQHPVSTTPIPTPTPTPTPIPAQPAPPSSSAHAAPVTAIVRTIAQVFAELGRFRCARALELTNTLPDAHRKSGLILAARARAFLDKADYESAAREYAACLSAEPSRVSGVAEYYSTVLWQLKRERDLAQLALACMRVHPVSAPAWCVAGNCFSLQRDSDNALRHFLRAVAAGCGGPAEAYARTLCGHEFLAKEDFDRALSCYRSALQLDDRLYPAMYGIGQVLLKQEKFALAQSHLRNAVHINPRNSVLHYHLGVALAASVANHDLSHAARRQTLLAALAELDTASNLDARNPVPRFERAKILAALGRAVDARRQLEDLRDRHPNEAEVHFELGCVCHKAGDITDAFTALSAAYDIEPKERKYKKALETLSSELESAAANSYQH